MIEQQSDAVANFILANLSEAVYQRLEPHFYVSDLPLGEELYRPMEPITKIYFPTTSLLSWVSLLEDGTLTEIALVGNTGVAGLSALWGGDYTPNSLLVQMAGKAVVADAAVAQQEFQQGGEFNQIISRYAQALFVQMAQNVACNRHHTTEERLARWLLSVQDGIQQNAKALSKDIVLPIELALTQEFMSKMLGVRRSSISISAGILQQAGMIRYRRGRLAILDREQLEATACECYHLVKQEYDRLRES